MMPALFTRPCNSVSLFLNSAAATATVFRSMRFICKKLMSAEGTIRFISVMAALALLSERAPRYMRAPCSARC